MSQLSMQRPSLDDLPELPVLPPGYTLRKYREGDLKPLATLLGSAFDDAEWTDGRVREALIDHVDVPSTYLIDYGGLAVATASAMLSPTGPEGSGTLFWVAAEGAHGGRRLGYAVSLAVLHEFVQYGCHDADLLTDDDRIPAIKTYLKLGFVPVYRDDTHPARWAEIERRIAVRDPT